MFANIDVKSAYSILKSSFRVEEIVQQALNNNQTHVGLIDLGTLHGVYYFYNLCLRNKIKPIIGCEFQNDISKYILIAKNFEGYLEISHYSSIYKTTTKFPEFKISNNLFIIASNDKNYLTYSDYALKPTYYATKEDHLAYKCINAINDGKFINLNSSDSKEKDLSFLSSEDAAKEFNSIQIENLNKLINGIDFK
jgi:DNA polymerase-3 subunit alpha